MRISATTIDQYRLFRGADWMSEQSLIDSIKGVFLPGPPVLAGMAYEKVIANPESFRVEHGYLSDGLLFPVESIERVAPLFNPAGVWQAKETVQVDLGGERITVVCKVDHLAGGVINELKTRWSGFDYEKYADAHQWRWYLVAFGAAFVQYTVACMKDPEEPTFESVERFRVFPYEGMRGDCVGLLSEFVDYVHMRGLESYLADDRYDHLQKGAA